MTSIKKHIAQSGERLDQIVYKNYQTLEVLSKVIEANPHLKIKTKLDFGDVVYLPIIEVSKTTIKEVQALW